VQIRLREPLHLQLKDGLLLKGVNMSRVGRIMPWCCLTSNVGLSDVCRIHWT